MLACLPADADAQRRRYPARSVVFVSGALVSPWHAYYGAWPQFGHPWGPWGPGAYGYPMRDVLTSSIRLEVTPRDAEVFVDGYSAGHVDDFDGIFQRLRVRPGSHEITLYKPGFRTVRQNLYLGPRADQKIRLDMEPLPAGDTAELPPPPRTDQNERRPLPFDEPFTEGAPHEVPSAPTPAATAPADRFGTLSVRVQPADAELVVDGERWAAPTDQDRITIRLTEGRHRLEIRKNGFSTYREEILIRRDRALSLNVSLLSGVD
jgi:hypothetical protein